MPSPNQKLITELKAEVADHKSEVARLNAELARLRAEHEALQHTHHRAQGHLDVLMSAHHNLSFVAKAHALSYNPVTINKMIDTLSDCLLKKTNVQLGADDPWTDATDSPDVVVQCVNNRFHCHPQPYQAGNLGPSDNLRQIVLTAYDLGGRP